MIDLVSCRPYASYVLFSLIYIAFLKLAALNEIEICKIFSFGHSFSEVFRFYFL